MTMCTLLSSQGPDAPEHKPQRSAPGATSLPYHSHPTSQTSEPEDRAVSDFTPHSKRPSQEKGFVTGEWPRLRPGSASALPHLWGDKRRLYESLCSAANRARIPGVSPLAPLTFPRCCLPSAGKNRLTEVAASRASPATAGNSRAGTGQGQQRRASGAAHDRHGLPGDLELLIGGYDEDRHA